jgi:hypothetical protein
MISSPNSVASSKISVSIDHPRIAFTEAGTERIVEPFVSRISDACSSRTEAESTGEFTTSSAITASSRFAPSSDADTIRT